MLYRLPSEFCAYFTPFVGLNWRRLGIVNIGCDHQFTVLQQLRLPHCHSSGDGVCWHLCQIQ